MEKQEKEPEEKKNGWKFYIHATSIFVICCISYALVSFHRSAPAIVSKDLSEEFNVSVTDLTVYSSMYFWVYGVMQPFGGLLADVMDPAYLIGTAQIINSLGSLICGLAKNLPVSIFGRFLVGFGCSSVYVPICKILTNWYHIKWYPILAGIIIAAGGVGGMISQAPLEVFAKKFGWRYAFYGIAIIGFVFGVITLFVFRLDPTKFGYAAVNKAITKQNDNNTTLKDRLIQLWHNFVEVVTRPLTYVFCVYVFFLNGVYLSFSSFWGGPYLRDCFPSFNSGTLLFSLSIAMLVGSLVFPSLSNLLHTRKWLLEFFSVVATILSIVLATCDTKMSYTTMYIVFMIWTMCTGAISSVAFTGVRENFEAHVTTTCIGFVNFVAFIGGAIIQQITGAILESTVDEPVTKYPHSSYIKAIWIPTAVMCGIGMFEQPFIPDKLQLSDKDLKDETTEHEEEDEEYKERVEVDSLAEI